MERDQCINHTPHRDDGEQRRSNQTRSVSAKVQEAYGKTAKDDGEIEPGEESAFVCEEDFWFDPGGQCDSFARSGLEQRLG